MSVLRRASEPRILIPLLLSAVFVADLASRALPRSWYAFREWEALENDRGVGAPFIPNYRFVAEAAYGDLSARGNLPELREYRTGVFTTDAWGYRSSGAVADHLPPAAILSGDSFAFGMGVSDDETLACQLSKLSGFQVYNGGGRTFDIYGLIKIARRLNLTRGTVIYEYLDRFSTPEPPIPIEPPKPKSRFIRPRKLLDDFFGFSPLGVYLRRVHRRLENDRILPNPSRRSVIVARLRNGSPMLFLPMDDQSPVESGPERAIRFWRWFAASLRKEGLDLVLVLVPNKAEVYASLTEDYRPAHLGDGSGHERVVRALNEGGIPTIDLTPVLRKRAEALLGEGRTVYFSDDTHWNREGIRVAAEAIYEVWRSQILDRKR